MNYLAIEQFDQVIMFSLVKKIQENPGDNLMNFSDIWQACSIAAPYLTPPVDVKDRTKFAYEIFEAVERLESTGVVWVFRTGTPRARKLQHIGFSEIYAKMTLPHVVFTHQDRMGLG